MNSTLKPNPRGCSAVIGRFWRGFPARGLNGQELAGAHCKDVARRLHCQVDPTPVDMGVRESRHQNGSGPRRRVNRLTRCIEAAGGVLRLADPGVAFDPDDCSVSNRVHTEMRHAKPCRGCLDQGGAAPRIRGRGITAAWTPHREVQATTASPAAHSQFSDPISEVYDTSPRFGGPAEPNHIELGGKSRHVALCQHDGVARSIDRDIQPDGNDRGC